MGMFDNFGDILSAINYGSSQINNLAQTIYQSGELDRSKEMYRYTQEENRNSLRENPSAYVQGLKNAGLSAQSINIGGTIGGSSVPSAAQWNSRSAEHKAANTQQMLAFNELANSQVNRDLSRAQIRKEDAQANLFDSQAMGQEIQNKDYENTFQFGGILGNQSLQSYLHNTFLPDSYDTQRMYNSLQRAILSGQLQDENIISAMRDVPVNEQKKVIAEINELVQRKLTEISQSNLFKAQAYSSRMLGGLYDAQTKGQLFTNNHILPNQRNQLWLGNAGLKIGLQQNPHTLGGAISTINEGIDDLFKGHFKGAVYKFGRGYTDYLLNGLFHFMGAGVDVYRTNKMSNAIHESNNTKLDIADMNNNKVITDINNKGYQSKRRVESRPKRRHK